MAKLKIKADTKLEAWVNLQPGPGAKPRLHVIGKVPAPNPGAFPFGVDNGYDKIRPPVHLVTVKNVQLPGIFTQVIVDQSFHYTKAAFDTTCKKVKLTLWTGETITLAVQAIS